MRDHNPPDAAPLGEEPVPPGAGGEMGHSARERRQSASAGSEEPAPSPPVKNVVAQRVLGALAVLVTFAAVLIVWLLWSVNPLIALGLATAALAVSLAPLVLFYRLLR